MVEKEKVREKHEELKCYENGTVVSANVIFCDFHTFFCKKDQGKIC